MNTGDDDIIDLRKGSKPEFFIRRADGDVGVNDLNNERATVSVVSESEVSSIAGSASDMVRVRFDKFVNLIASHVYEDVLDRHVDDDVIISTNLLTDLANAHDDSDEEKKFPWLFLLGIVFGVAVTWILIKA